MSLKESTKEHISELSGYNKHKVEDLYEYIEQIMFTLKDRDLDTVMKDIINQWEGE